MARKELSAEQIQQVVSERIQALETVQEDGTKVRVPLPLGHAPDDTGRNWNMEWFGNATGYEGDIRLIVDKARDEFELAQVVRNG